MMDMIETGRSDWFAGCLTSDPSRALPLVFMGVCDDSQSSFIKGAAEAPPLIRSCYDARGYNASSESGVDLEESVFDAGDLYPGITWSDSCHQYFCKMRELLGAGRIPFAAGGDHAVTVPLVEAFESFSRPIHFLQIDAHPDLYPEYDGNRHSHACVAARILEMKHVVSVTCLGVRTSNSVQRAVLEKSRSRCFEVPARECSGAVLPALPHIRSGEPLYLSVDLDGFDPAFAPGVSHPVPGGLTPRQVLNLIQSAPWKLVGMDVVEVNPGRDENGRTCVLAGRLLHEGMGFAAKQLGLA